MPSKFFGNRFDKQTKVKGKNNNQRFSENKANKQNSRSKSSGVRKVGRGG